MSNMKDCNDKDIIRIRELKSNFKSFLDYVEQTGEALEFRRRKVLFKIVRVVSTKTKAKYID